MRKANFKPKFLKDLKALKRKRWEEEKLFDVIGILLNEGRVPSHRHPHKLHGEYAGNWKCHEENDWLLIYDVTETEVHLIRTGTHGDLF